MRGMERIRTLSARSGDQLLEVPSYLPPEVSSGSKAIALKIVGLGILMESISNRNVLSFGDLPAAF